MTLSVFSAWPADDLIAERRIVQAEVDLIVERLLLDIGQQIDKVRGLIAVVVSDRRRQIDHDAVDIARQPAGHVVIVVQGDAELLEVIAALRSAGRLAAACTAGRSSATSTPMMAMTTSSSTSVKPCGDPVIGRRCAHDLHNHHVGLHAHAGAGRTGSDGAFAPRGGRL